MPTTFQSNLTYINSQPHIPIMESIDFKENKAFETILKQSELFMLDDTFAYILRKWFCGEETILPKYIKYPFGTNEWITKRCKDKVIVGQTHNSHNGCINGCFNCVSEDSLILMADLSLRKIKDINIGDKIIGISEVINKYRRIKEATVTNKWESLKDAYEITLEDGTKIVCSEDHRWLTTRGWKYTIGKMSGQNRRPYLTMNNRIQQIPIPEYKEFDNSDAFKMGYIAGIIDGDGTMGIYKDKRRSEMNNDKQYIFSLRMQDEEAIDRTKKYLEHFGVDTIYFSVNDSMNGIRSNKKENYHKLKEIMKIKNEMEFYRGYVGGFFDADGSFGNIMKKRTTDRGIRLYNTNEDYLKKVKNGLSLFGFKYKETKNDADRYNEKMDIRATCPIYTIRLKGGRREIIRFFNIFDPNITRKRSLFGLAIKHSSKIVSIKKVGKKIKMIDLTTTTENFVANGCVAHNCYACNLCYDKGWEWWKWYGVKTERKDKWNVNWKKKPDGYIFMYPSMHDTFIHTVDDANAVIGNMLKANGEVLFVSKPIEKVIKTMLDFLEDNFAEVMHKVTMRFSITTPNTEEIKFWEGNAKFYSERKNCLKLVKESGCKSSVSAERFLKTGIDSINGTIQMGKDLLPYVDDTLWFGLLNHIPKDKDGNRYLNGRQLTEFEVQKIEELEAYYTFDNIFKLVEKFWNNPQVMWKESIKKRIVKHIRKNPVYN